MTVTAIIAEDEQLFRDALINLLREEWPGRAAVIERIGLRAKESDHAG